MIPDSCTLIDLTVEGSYDTSFCRLCRTEADIQSSQEQVLISGLSFAHCGDIVYQVVQCHTPDCNGRFVFRSTIDASPLDMGNLIMMPETNLFIAQEEQRRICNDWEKWPEKLKFQYRTLWDEKHISQQEFIDFVEASGVETTILEGHLYLSSEERFWKLLSSEYEKHEFLLKRFYPNTPLNNALMTYVSLPKKTTIDPHISYFDESNDYIHDKTKAFLYLMELYTGEDIHSAVMSRLKNHGIKIINEKEKENLRLEIEINVSYKIMTTQSSSDLIHKSLLKYDYKSIEAIFKDNFGSIVYPICTKLFLKDSRKDLLSWTKKAKQGVALFVDAPMGVGKTYSIAEGLASNPDKSAIIFMPTKKLCKDLRYKLAEEISIQQKRFPEHDDIIPFNDNYPMEFDENDNLISQYTEKYYHDRGIYLFDGINKEECIHYDEIINRYKSGYYRKKDLCDKCLQNKTCRFLLHKEILNNYRIVITTHYMYDFFYYNSTFRKWKILSENGDVIEKKTRDYFIIDEDFIFTNCYQPISLSESQLINFVITITDFFKNPDYVFEAVEKKYFQSTDLILGLASKTMESSIIPAIDPSFKYPKFLNEAWGKSLKEQEEIIPDEVLQAHPKKSYPFYVGDYLSKIENAIRKGFVIQVHDQTRVKTILLPNPKEYSFKGRKLPAHVFFDGTKLESKYIRKKLKGVIIKPLDIKIDKLLWDVKVFQNTNTDLPKTKSPGNLTDLKKIISIIVKKHGPHERYFVLTNKTIKNEIQDFVRKRYSDFYFVIEYYGNLRGLNTAQRCSVGIILGSLILPDTVEIAMSFDFIYRKLKRLPPYPLKILENIWSWRGNLGIKQYKENYQEIEALSKMYRHSEYRQALARTRYLSHPATFYIFSKERIDTYEPYINKIEDLEFCNDIFPPKPKHPNNQSEKIEQLVFDWLRTNPSVSATDIFNHYPNVRRQTVAKHLKEMKKRGLLRLYENYKSKYANIFI